MRLVSAGRRGDVRSESVSCDAVTGADAAGRAATRTTQREYAGRGEAAPAKRLRHQPRIADAPEHRRRIAPQRAPGGQRRHRSRMVVEVDTYATAAQSMVRAARAAACALVGAPKSRGSERLRTDG